MEEGEVADRMEAARQLVTRSDGDPQSVCELALAMLEGADHDSLDPAEALAAWALGLALRHLRDLDAALGWLERASNHFTIGSDDHTSVNLTLAGTLAFAGDLSAADAILDSTNPSVELSGRITYQRAAIAERLGEVGQAEKGYQEALDAFRLSADRLGEGHALNGLGLIAIQQGRADDALLAFESAEMLYTALGLGLLAAIAEHNQGLASTRLGDFERATELLESTAEHLALLGEPFVEVALDQVELLMLLGRTEQAAERATQALAQLQKSGASTDRAELLIALGVALHRAGRKKVGNRALDVAEVLLEQQDRPAWASVVRLRRLEVAEESAPNEILAVGDALRQAGLDEPAADADALALDHHLLDNAPAADCIARLRSLPIVDPRRSYAEALDAFNGSDPAGAGRIAREAVAATTRQVIDSTSIETRAAMLSLRDRVSRVAVRAATGSGEASELIELVRCQQTASLQSPPPAEASAVVAMPRLDPPKITMYDDGEQLVLVESDGPSSTFGDAPPREEFISAMRRHAAVLDDALRHPASDASPVQQSAKAVQRFAPWLTDGDIISLAVNGELFNAPWSSVAAGPIRVVADMSPAVDLDAGTTVLLGPGLVTGATESEELQQLLGDRCTVVSDGDPLVAISRASGATLHICSHGRHDPVNPLTSSYELSGGRLTAREIEAHGVAPALVVAAACRAGRTQHLGTTSIGLPTAWLSIGTGTIIASSFALPDDKRTVATMKALHQALHEGAPPEVAVFASRVADDVIGRCLVVVGRMRTAG